MASNHRPLCLLLVLMLCFGAIVAAPLAQIAGGTCAPNGATASPDSSGRNLVCTSGTWAIASPDIPSGLIAAFATTTCPTGWSEYTAARGRFLRGLDNGVNLDPAGTRAPGNQQTDAFQGHQHYVANTNPAAYDNNYNVSGVRYSQAQTGVTSGYLTDGAYGTPRVSSETRPVNVAVLFCTKN